MQHVHFDALLLLPVWSGCWFDVSEWFVAVHCDSLDKLMNTSLLSGENLASLKCVRNLKQLNNFQFDHYLFLNICDMVSQTQAVTEMSRPIDETREPDRISHDSQGVALYAFSSLASVLIREFFMVVWIAVLVCLCPCASEHQIQYRGCVS